jgi:tetratricopeptide (TPR) repeat protein
LRTDDIIEQGDMMQDVSKFTPAQKYRKALSDLSGTERVILRLEQRWKKNLKKWTKAAIKLQCFVRVFFSRGFVASLRAQSAINESKKARILKALEAFRSRRFDEALSEADKSLSLDNKCLDGHRVRGHVFLAKKDFEASILAYSSALDLDVNNIECRLGRARCHCISENWGFACADLVHLMDIDPCNPTYWRLRGFVNSRLRNWPGAVSDFTKCIQLGVRSPSIWIQRGMAESSSQRWIEATESFSVALEESPQAGIYCLRGRVYCCLRKWNEAEDDFKKALKLDPGCEDAKMGLSIVETPHLPLPLTDV